MSLNYSGQNDQAMPELVLVIIKLLAHVCVSFKVCLCCIFLQKLVKISSITAFQFIMFIDSLQFPVMEDALLSV